MKKKAPSADGQVKLSVLVPPALDDSVTVEARADGLSKSRWIKALVEKEVSRRKTRVAVTALMQ